MPKKILVYYQNPYPSIFIESLVQELIRREHKVYFHTKCVRGVLHDRIEKHGAIVTWYNPSAPQLFRFILHWWNLIRFCRKNKIDVVFSHLQLANLVTLFAKYFFKAKVYPCRHHVDEVMIVRNKTAMRIDKAVNILAKKIIVVSNPVKQHMIDKEGVKPERIEVIPLGYNFDLYAKPDPESVHKIREQMNCQLLLIVIARMTPAKRHIITLEVLNKLVKDGLDVKLMILDRGPEEVNLRKYIADYNLEDKVLFTGFLNNTMDYMAAADLLLNPSIIEASNQVVKEIAILGKTCIVCSGVGDFNEYIIHDKNGFLVSKENTATEMTEIVRDCYKRIDDLKEMGQELRKEVLVKFDVRHVGEKYLQVAGIA